MFGGKIMFNLMAKSFADLTGEGTLLTRLRVRTVLHAGWNLLHHRLIDASTASYLILYARAAACVGIGNTLYIV